MLLRDNAAPPPFLLDVTPRGLHRPVPVGARRFALADLGLAVAALRREGAGFAFDGRELLACLHAPAPERLDDVCAHLRDLVAACAGRGSAAQRVQPLPEAIAAASPAWRTVMHVAVHGLAPEAIGDVVNAAVGLGVCHRLHLDPAGELLTLETTWVATLGDELAQRMTEAVAAGALSAPLHTGTDG